MKQFSGVLAVSALVALTVSSQGCAKLKELLKDPQADQPQNLRPAQDYAFANGFCERAEQLSPTVRDTVKAIETRAESNLTSYASSSLEKIRTERKAAGDERSRCQILEDVIEYGPEYARGKNVDGNDAQMLTLEDQTAIDLSVIASLSVSGLNLSSDRILDLTPLSKMTRLRTLWLTANPFWDLSPVSSLKNLKELTLAGCTGVRDLAPIVTLDRLEHLTLSDMRLMGTPSNYHPLQAMKNLKILDLRGSDVPSATVFPDAKLEALFVDTQTFGDTELGQIASMYPGLQQLSYRTPLVRDLSAVSRLTVLTVLDVPAGAYQNLDALHGMTNLADVSVRDLGPNDVATLASLPKLVRLAVDAPLKSPSELGALQALRGISSLDVKYLGDLAALDALSGLPNLERLVFTDFAGRIGSITAIASMPKLSVFSLNWAKVQDITPLYGFLDSRKSASVMMNGCELSRTQESLHNTLRDKFGTRYLPTNITWR